MPVHSPLFAEVMTYLEKCRPEPACIAFLLPSDDPNHPPLELPVTVSGVVFLDYQKGKTVHHIPCVVGVIPQEGATLLLIGTTRKHQAFLKAWQKHAYKDAFGSERGRSSLARPTDSAQSDWLAKLCLPSG